MRTYTHPGRIEVPQYIKNLDDMSHGGILPNFISQFNADPAFRQAFLALLSPVEPSQEEGASLRDFLGPKGGLRREILFLEAYIRRVVDYAQGGELNEEEVLDTVVRGMLDSFVRIDVRHSWKERQVVRETLLDLIESIQESLRWSDFSLMACWLEKIYQYSTDDFPFRKVEMVGSEKLVYVSLVAKLTSVREKTTFQSAIITAQKALGDEPGLRNLLLLDDREIREILVDCYFSPPEEFVPEENLA